MSDYITDSAGVEHYVGIPRGSYRPSQFTNYEQVADEFYMRSVIGDIDEIIIPIDLINFETSVSMGERQVLTLTTKLFNNNLDFLIKNKYDVEFVIRKKQVKEEVKQEEIKSNKTKVIFVNV